MPPDGTVNIAQSPEDLRAKVNAQVLEENPTFFRLEAQLSARGPHRHADDRLGQDVGRVEDLCGRRRERAAAHHETRTVGNNEGVLLPHSTFY